MYLYTIFSIVDYLLFLPSPHPRADANVSLICCRTFGRKCIGSPIRIYLLPLCFYIHAYSVLFQGLMCLKSEYEELVATKPIGLARAKYCDLRELPHHATPRGETFFLRVDNTFEARAPKLKSQGNQETAKAAAILHVRISYTHSYASRSPRTAENGCC